MKPKAAAVVVRDDHLLVIHRRKHGTEYFTLPGGGVQPGESAVQACARELEEEAGLHVVVGECLLTLENAGRCQGGDCGAHGGQVSLVMSRTAPLSALVAMAA
jgi:ADP-ribose pyrophosphatase YjhB (NUDIX family)